MNRKTTLGKIEFGRRIIAKMTDNVNYPDVQPPLDQITIATNELEIAMINAHGGDSEKIAIRNEKEEAFDVLIKELAAYVQMASKGVKSVILSAGMEVKKPAEPIGELQPPAGLKATNGAGSGSIDLRWSSVYGAKSYVIKVTSSPSIPGSYTQVGISTAAKFTVDNLECGKDYWFIVAAIGTAGMSEYSAPVTIMAT